MSRRPRLRAKLLPIVGLLGCAHVEYKGPRRPPNEVATIEESANESVVMYIDGKYVRGSGRHEVLPGWHPVGITLWKQEDHFFYETVRYARATLIVCLDARAGHTYETRAIITGDLWRPAVVDQATGRKVDIQCEPPRPPATVEAWSRELPAGRIPITTDALLTPHMDRPAFQRMNPLALLASEGVIYATYRLGPIEAGGRTLDVLATFAREKLWMVELVDANLDGQELAEPMKARAKTRNDEWLNDLLGGAGPRFPWGSVQSRSDRKDGVPGIVIRYF